MENICENHTAVWCEEASELVYGGPNQCLLEKQNLEEVGFNISFRAGANAGCDFTSATRAITAIPLIAWPASLRMQRAKDYLSPELPLITDFERHAFISQHAGRTSQS